MTAACRALPTDLATWARVLRAALVLPRNELKYPKHFKMRNLDTREAVSWPPAPPTIVNNSAVLVLLAPTQDTASLNPKSADAAPLLDLAMPMTMRCSSLRSHSGQMAFPGGRCEENETPMVAAARETLEEVGITHDAYTEIGHLSRVWSLPSLSWVTPVVALAHAPVLPRICSPSEVSSVHQLHLSWCLFNSNLSHMRLQKYWTYRAEVSVTVPCIPTSSRSYEVPRENLTIGGPLVKAEGSEAVPLSEALEPGEKCIWGLTSLVLCEFITRLATTLDVPLAYSNVEVLDWEPAVVMIDPTRPSNTMTSGAPPPKSQGQ